jgi:flagellar hook-basal body complex protein FliE
MVPAAATSVTLFVSFDGPRACVGRTLPIVGKEEVVATGEQARFSRAVPTLALAGGGYAGHIADRAPARGFPDAARERTMNPVSMDSLLAKLNAAREAASQLPGAAGAAKGTGAARALAGTGATGAAGATRPVDFASMLAKTIGQVDQSQQSAATMAEQFQLGAKGVTLEDTMVSLQKANISFQAMVQVRNKVVAAYSEIMNMQV